MKNSLIYARIRPSLFGQSQPVFQKISDRSLRQTRPDALVTYTFDKVYQHQSNLNIYQDSISGLIDTMLEGKSMVIIAYGQTGSGKTHTIFGHGPVKGINDLIIESLLQFKLQHKAVISGRFLQVYNQKVRDLQNGSEVRLFEKQSQLILQGSQEIPLDGYDDFRNFYDKAQAQKKIGSSYVHDLSSRSHTICNIRMQVGSLQSMFSLVDLCGAQLLDLEKGKQQNKQTNSINLSLLNLCAIVDAMQSGSKHVPFRNSVLTRILKQSLLSSQRIIMFCTISPDARHVAFSRRTLQFGKTAKSAKESSSKQPSLSQLARQSKVVLPRQPFRQIPELTNTRQPFNYYSRGNREGKIVLMLHAQGGDCSALDWYYMFYAFNECDYRVIALDFPGHGLTAGSKPSSRTQNFNNKGETCEFMDKVFKHFKIGKQNKAILLGYDYGGNVALHLSLHKNFRTFIDHIVLFHPNYTQDFKNLEAIRQSVLLFWVKSDLMHLYKDGQRMAKKIKNCKMYSIKCTFQQQRNQCYYMGVGSWVSGVVRQHFQPKISVEVQLLEETEEQKQLNSQKQRQATMRQFQSMMKDIKQWGLSIKRTSALTLSAKKLFSRLITIGQQPDIDQLNAIGLFVGMQLKQHAQYPRGRQIHCRIPMNGQILKEGFMKYNKTQALGISCLYSVQKADRKNITILTQEGPLQLPFEAVHRLNGPTNFRRNFKGNLVFEDGVVADYQSPIMKAKMMECAVKVNRIVSSAKQLDIKLQKLCIEVIWESIDLIHLVHEGISKQRLCQPDAGKLALFGQGNCHHLAGVLAAFLIPFGKILGWSVIFRAGFYLKRGRDIDQKGVPLPGWNGRPRQVQDHTWLQVVLWPKGQLRIVDPSQNKICVQLQSYRRGHMLILDRLSCGSSSPQAPKEI